MLFQNRWVFPAMAESDLAVGIAELKSASVSGRLVAYGLGSCVGVTLYDRFKKIGGLAHIMLPSSRMHSQVSVPGKYADTAVAALLEILGREGADLKNLEAKLVGGANMFISITHQAVPIGMRNVSAVRDQLGLNGIKVKGEDIGGAQGRTIFFSLEDGKIEIRKLNQPTRLL